MKTRPKNLLLSSLLLLTCVIISSCSLFGSSPPAATATPVVHTTPGAGSPVANPGLDMLVKQALDSINQYGYGDPTKYSAYKGIWINWYRNSPTAHQNSGHDGQNDIRDYENMLWYQARHPGDTSLQQYINRLQPLIQKEWTHSGLPKGWVYFIFQRLAQYGDNTTWTNTMKHWAGINYKHIDPSIGISHSVIVASTGKNSPSCPDGYRVDQNLENGLALVDAGTRFGHSEWTQAGMQEVDTVIKQAFVTKYHMFARIVCQGKIWDWEAKGGEIGQETDALLKVGTYTHNNTYLDLAKEILDSVSNPATGLRDTQNNGIYYKLLLDTGHVDKSRKEMRQFHILQVVHEANALFNNRYADFEASLIALVKSSFFSPPVAGWMYEVSNDSSMYKGENWISMEASGIAMEAIQTILSPNQ